MLNTNIRRTNEKVNVQVKILYIGMLFFLFNKFRATYVAEDSSNYGDLENVIKSEHIIVSKNEISEIGQKYNDEIVVPNEVVMVPAIWNREITDEHKSKSTLQAINVDVLVRAHLM